MNCYAIYEYPADFPDKYVVREWFGLTSQIYPTLVADTLEECEAFLTNMGKVSFGSHEDDEPNILSIWL